MDGASQFVMADGDTFSYKRMQKAAGVFAFLAGLLGYYTTAHYLFADALGFSLPMGDTSKWFARKRPDVIAITSEV